MIGNINEVLNIGEKIAERTNQINFLKQIVANYYQLDSVEHLILKTRQRKYITARHNAMYLIGKLFKITSVDIGTIFNCDHSTVLHAVKKINGFLSWDEDLRKELSELEQIIKLKGFAFESKDKATSGFYFVDLNNFISIKGPGNRAILLSGFTMSEVAKMRFLDEGKADWFLGYREMMQHESTGLYILEKLKESENDKSKEIEG
jgi:hypothetical protein